MTVKCRLGVDELESYEYLYEFINHVSTGVLPGTDQGTSSFKISDSLPSSGGPREGIRKGEEFCSDDERWETEDCQEDQSAKCQAKSQVYAGPCIDRIDQMKELELIQRRERKLEQHKAGQKVVEHFVVHARKALLLGGCSTIDNRRYL